MSLNIKKKIFKKSTLLILIPLFLRLMLSIIIGISMYPIGLLDDVIMFNYATKAHYLIPNVYSLVKNMSFPWFLDVVYISQLPFTLWFLMIWFLAAIYTRKVILKISKNKMLAYFFYLYILFNPLGITLLTALKVYRNVIMPPFIIILFTFMIDMTVENYEGKINILKMLIFSMLFSFLYYVKEDGAWLTCCLLFFIVLNIIILIVKKKNNIKKQVFMLFIPIAIFILFTNSYKMMNKHFFGVYEINTRTEGELGRFVNNIYKIESENRDIHCWAPYDAIEKAFSSSKTLSEYQNLLDGILYTDSYGFNGDIEKNPIHGDFLTWVLRYELEKNGIWTSEKEVSDLFKKVNIEIDEAFKNGTLKKDKNFQIVKSAGGYDFDDIKKVMSYTIESLKVSVLLNDFEKDLFNFRYKRDMGLSDLADSNIEMFKKYLNENYVIKEENEITKLLSNTIYMIYRVINVVFVSLSLFYMIYFLYKNIIEKKMLKRRNYIMTLSAILFFLIAMTYAFCISWFIGFIIAQDENVIDSAIIYYNLATPVLMIYVYMFFSINLLDIDYKKLFERVKK